MAKMTGTLTIRNVPMTVIRALKAQARRNNQSMEQEARDLLAAQLGERAAVLREIRDSWQWQTRPLAADEVESWIQEGRD